MLAADQLARDLAAIEAMPRNQVGAALKALRARALAVIADDLNAEPGKRSGVAVAARVAAMTDQVVLALARRAFARVPVSEREAHVALFAVGGYGRQEQNPRSDLDLLVLTGDKPPAWATTGNQELQALLWDAGFQVGASLRALGELERMCREDFVTATAVIESRSLATAAATAAWAADGMARLLDGFRRKRCRDFLRYKVEELEKRRAQTGVSVFLMEPNLKSNPGCLRDVQLLRNAAFMLYGVRDLHALEELEVIARGDLDEVAAANDYLLRLRSLLHFHHGRKQDVFQLADQLRVAQQLGYQDVSQLRAVEHFMKRHYAITLHVHQSVELVLSRLHARGHLGRKPILVLSRRTLDADFVAVERRVYLSHHDFWELPDAGARLIRMCRAAQSRGWSLSLELQRAIRAHLHVITDAVRHDRALGRVFLALLGDVGRVRPILSDMHRCGLLGAFLPEFGNLTCHMQFDSYHQYTVDEHTLIAVGHLDAVANGEAPGLPGMDRLFPAVERKDLLVLGLLLHDMGKYMGRGHVARGALMVAPVAHRLGLDQAEEELVYFLVERHVALSDASRMRDFREPGFLKAFTEKMGSQRQLDLLYCLTYADAKAVGEGVLTGWQEQLLHEIHQAVSGQLAALAGAAPASPHERLRRELAACGLAADAADAWLADLGDGYAFQVPPGEVARHHRVLADARAGGVGLDHAPRDKYVQVIAAAPDRHALFADVTATLTGHGFDIIGTRTWVTASGLVLYDFRLSHVVPGRLGEASTWTRLKADLLAMAQGRLDAATMFARRRAMLVASRPADSRFDDPAVKVEQRTSDTHTIVDIHTKDEAGLLSRLCRAISDHGCDIGYACINTMGDVAVDVFYVQRNRAKLSDEDAEGLRRHLIEALNLRAATATA